MARQIRDAGEQDAYTPWRRYLCYLQRAGVVKSIKRRTHKRERQDAKRSIHADLQERD